MEVIKTIGYLIDPGRKTLFSVYGEVKSQVEITGVLVSSKVVQSVETLAPLLPPLDIENQLNLLHAVAVSFCFQVEWLSQLSLWLSVKRQSGTWPDIRWYKAQWQTVGCGKGFITHYGLSCVALMCPLVPFAPILQTVC